MDIASVKPLAGDTQAGAYNASTPPVGEPASERHHRTWPRWPATRHPSSTPKTGVTRRGAGLGPHSPISRCETPVGVSGPCRVSPSDPARSVGRRLWIAARCAGPLGRGSPSVNGGGKTGCQELCGEPYSSRIRNTSTQAVGRAASARHPEWSSSAHSWAIPSGYGSP